MPAAGHRSGLRRRWGEVVGHRFDLATEIPLRAKLFRVAEGEHVLVGVVHHIAGDGRSIAPLVRDLGWRMRRGRQGGCRRGRRCRCSTSITLWQRAQFGDLDDPAV